MRSLAFDQLFCCLGGVRRLALVPLLVVLVFGCCRSEALMECDVCSELVQNSQREGHWAYTQSLLQSARIQIGIRCRDL